MEDDLTRTLRTAIAKSPTSRRELCRAAGVEQSVLARVLTGERRATPLLCKRIARALQNFGTNCTEGAMLLRRALISRKGD